MENKNWPDGVRLKMIEKSEFYGDSQTYQYGFYDGYQLRNVQCKKLYKLLSISHRLIGEIIDNYEADAINLPAEIYNELKFHSKQLEKISELT